MRIFAFMCCGMVLAFVTSVKVWSYSTYQAADIVIGQADMTSNSVGASANRFNGAHDVYIAGSKLCVTDHSNCRVLIYNSIPTTNNSSADVVVGQSSISGTPDGITYLDSPYSSFCVGTRFFVADFNNHRVLIFNSIPTSNRTLADLVIGQTAVTNKTLGTGASGMNRPTFMTTDGTRLLVGDQSYHRILIYNSVPTSNGVAANVVVGQSNFTTYISGSGSGNLNAPAGMGIYNGKLIVADMGNNRVLIFNSVPTTNGVMADVVLGQPDFFTVSTGCSASKMAGPADVYVDSQGRLFVTDSGNHRVLIFNSIPTSNGASADLVFGQPDMIHSTNGRTAQNLTNPRGIDGLGTKIFVTEYGNNRVLVFNDFVRVDTISEAHGITGSTCNVMLTGVNFASDMTLKLSGGGVDVLATAINIINSTSATCTFQLNAFPGLYDVVVSRPNLAANALVGAFSILAPSTPTPTATPLVIPTVTVTPVALGAFLKVYNGKINPLKNQKALVRWSQPQETETTIIIYNVVGDKIVTLADHRIYSRGTLNEVVWDGKNSNGQVVGSGIYVVYIKTDGFESYSKCAVVK